MLLDVQLDAPPDQLRTRAAEFAALGLDGLFTFEGSHDVFVPLAAVAPTAELDLMTNVAVALPRSPLHAAHAAYDLHHLSRGRFRLGLGSQIRPHIEHRYGTPWSRPAARMGEFVRAVKTILDAWQTGEPLNFRGEFTRHTLMPPTFDPGPNPYGVPPVLMGALGPIMTRTAAATADGLLVMPFNSARHFRERTLPAVRDGLARAGRDRADFTVVPQVMAALGRTPAEVDRARAGVRALLAFYASTPAYLPVLDIEGHAHLQPVLDALAKRSAFAEMAAHIDDETLSTFAVVGTPEDCAHEIEARFGGEADRVCVYFPGYTPAGEHLADLARALHALR
ncbi:TIGR03617 family F420-dependent LLM class oxidoreductase [Nocardia sp. ET3-3]|uniref:TIGR03617 family F420-dependent LLM class oxidoreductase n=1 Tax=Nocardia terrae TaxID=2675851 RepID=A0A7K1V878_9NOCA|nr:TIGR03617 family F420-dependent LLM class oxidoreductase [Nocardia terrae]MVU82863.1 TIGR03617 family F420-dependent LLM class oxidoreductase [Nocardia terrae]